MKRSTVILVFIEMFLCTLFLMNIFVINIRNAYIISSFLAVNILLIIYLLGYEKNRQRLKKDAILNTFIFSSLLQIILYLSGLLFGFLNNAYSMKFNMIISNILPVVLLIVVGEILRYVINQKGRESKLILVLSCITFIVIESAFEGLFYNLQSKKDMVELLCLIVIPSISKNIFLTYNTTKFGFESSIVYRIVLETLIYVTPIIPNVSDYLTAVINFLYPIIVLFITKNTIGKVIPQEEVIYKKPSRLPLLITIIFISTLIILNSGLAPLYILAIGSGSMEKTIYKGDAVIVKKIDNNSITDINEGDILVYKYQGKVIVHRVYTIDKMEKRVNIVTKGDNNEYPDAWAIGNEHVIGKVIFNIKYVGLPTIWLNDLLD